jgi:membrane protease YdiL (CAAX protease family)
VTGPTPPLSPSQEVAPPDARPPTKAGVLLRVLVCLLFTFAGLFLVGPLLTPGGQFLGAILSTFAGAAIGNALALRIFERGHLADIGLYWSAASARNLGLGFLGGAGAAHLVLALPLIAGAAEFQSSPGEVPTWGAMMFVSILLLFGALSEEVLFRGYAFQILVSAFGVWATILPLGALFGLMHWMNPSATALGTLNTALWGVVLGWSVLRSGDLWLAIGLHFGWNWTLPLYGVQLSGFNIKVTRYAMQWKIGELWSGGDYGPEGGLLCTLVVGLLVLYLWKAPIVRQSLRLVERGTEPSS